MGHMTGRRRATGYGAITLYGREFNPVRLTRRFITPAGRVGARTHDPTTPHAQPPTGTTRARFGLIRFRSPLLTEYPFLQVLRCFTSLRTPRPTKRAVPAHDGRWVPPFGNPRIKALLAAPRGLSQPHTSFIGPVCQGIHHTPFTDDPANRHGRTRNKPANTGQQIITQNTITKRSNERTPYRTGPVRKNSKSKTQDPTGPRSLLASTIQFSNHHAPGPGPPRPHGHGTPPRDTRNNHHPHPEQTTGKRGPGSRSGNPKACRTTTTREPPISSTPARPRPPDHPATQAKGPRKAPARNSVERR